MPTTKGDVSDDVQDADEAPEAAARTSLEESVERARSTATSLVESRTAQLWAGAALATLVLLLLAGVSVSSVLVIGLQRGAVFSLIGLGLALVYKATRVLNFAQAALGSAPAFLAYAVMVGSLGADIRASLDTGRLWWATLLAIAFGVLLALLINVLVVQRLANVTGVTTLVATAGVLLLIVQGQVLIFEAQPRPFPRYIEGDLFSVGNTAVPWHTVLIVVVLIAAATALALFFRTPLGIALLATAQEPFAAELAGVSVRRMSALAWGLAGALGAIGGLLGAGVFEGITPGFMLARFFIPAFVGAVLGGLTSMVGAVLGGLLIGLVVALATEAGLAVSFLNDVPGIPQIATLTVLVAVLLFRPRGLFGQEA